MCVGLPLTLSGEVDRQSVYVVDFVKRLREEAKFKTPILFWDERLSTSGAFDMMDERGVPDKRKKEMEDAFAAASVLQSLLDRLRRL